MNDKQVVLEEIAEKEIVPVFDLVGSNFPPPKHNEPLFPAYNYMSCTPQQIAKINLEEAKYSHLLSPYRS